MQCNLPEQNGCELFMCRVAPKKETGGATRNGKSSWVQAQTSLGFLCEPNSGSSSFSGTETTTTTTATTTTTTTTTSTRRSRKERIAAARLVQGSSLDDDASQGGGQDVSPMRSRSLLPFAQGKHSSRMSFPTKEANPSKLGHSKSPGVRHLAVGVLVLSWLRMGTRLGQSCLG